MSNEAERSYRVLAKAESAGPERPAGVIRIDAANRVTVVSTEPQFADVLNLAANTLNDSDVFSVRVVPPGAKPFSLHKKRVPRDSPEAPAALLTELRKTYGFTLEPA